MNEGIPNLNNIPPQEDNERESDDLENISLEKELGRKVEVIDLDLEQKDLKEMDRIHKLNELKMSEGNAGELYLKKNKFALDLKEKMGDRVYECALYYILIDGGISPAAAEKIHFLDFDGDDSVANFIESL